MLDDNYLIKKIIVVVAVDEDLLEKAINWKYSSSDDSQSKGMNRISEYMDKLFICGIKLPKLSIDDQAIMLERYAEKILEDEDKNEEILKVEEIEPAGTVASIGEIETLVFPDTSNPTFIDRQSDFFLMRKELQLLQDYSNKISEEVTPRQLRIFLYRYLLAKNLASDYLFRFTNQNQLPDTYCEFLVACISHKSNSIEEFDFEPNFSLEQINDVVLREFTPKLIEMVVPY
jgi:hypothetical protein